MSQFLRRQKGAGGKWKTKQSCKQDQEITNYEKKKVRIKMLMCIFFLAPKNKVLLTSSKSFACEKRFFIIPPLY